MHMKHSMILIMKNIVYHIQHIHMYRNDLSQNQTLYHFIHI